MKAIRPRRAERETPRMQANREKRVDRIMRAVPEDGIVQPLEGLCLARASAPLERSLSVVKPSLWVLVQGSKEVLLGDSRYQYDPAHYLITPLELPCVSYVVTASPAQPWLGFRLDLRKC
jgi:hypothetical protein